MDAPPKFCILLAVFNGRQYLEEQLFSIFTQQEVACEVFVNIDESADGSEELILEWSMRESRIHLLPTGYKFGGAAPNFFKLLAEVDLTKFDYISFADQDDIWLPDKLLKAHRCITENAASGYSSNVMAFWLDERQALIKKSQPQVERDFLFEAAGPGCTYVLQKELAIAIQALVRSRYEEIQDVGLHDWFAYAFARANGYRWVIDDYAGMLYRQHENNQVGVNLGWKAMFSRARKVFSGWGIQQSVLIAELVGLGNDPFVRRWADGSRLGFLWLACRAWQCRRRLRDKFLFALSCLMLCVVGMRRP